MASNLLAVIGTAVVIVDVAWPRAAIYGNDHWYLQYGALIVVGLLLAIGIPYYWLKQRGSTFGVVLDEHRPDETDRASAGADAQPAAHGLGLTPAAHLDLGTVAVQVDGAQA